MKKYLAQNKLTSTLLTLLVIVSIAFFGYYKLTQNKIKSAKEIELHTYELQQINYKIESEVKRCNNLLSQGEGNFDEYEYCTGFVKYFSPPKVGK